MLWLAESLPAALVGGQLWPVACAVNLANHNRRESPPDRL
jgi:hypothetical protein